MEVTGIGIQDTHLALRGANDFRMAVAHVAHVVYSIQEDAAHRVEKVRPGPSNDLQRMLVGDAQGRADPLCTLR